MGDLSPPAPAIPSAISDKAVSRYTAQDHDRLAIGIANAASADDIIF